MQKDIVAERYSAFVQHLLCEWYNKAFIKHFSSHIRLKPVFKFAHLHIM